MKILLAVDGSKYSDAAVQALASKIRKEDADVLVLQVVEPRIFSTPPQMAAGYEPEMAEIMKEQFQNAQQTVDCAVAALKAAGFNAKGRVVEAVTRSGILDLASQWRADLIVDPMDEKAVKDSCWEASRNRLPVARTVPY